MGFFSPPTPPVTPLKPIYAQVQSLANDFAGIAYDSIKLKEATQVRLGRTAVVAAGKP